MSALKIERRGDGSAAYTTVDGDVVDHIAWRFYGREWGTTEAVLDANPGLAARGAILPAGVTVILPAIAAEPATRRDSIQLFD